MTVGETTGRALLDDLTDAVVLAGAVEAAADGRPELLEQLLRGMDDELVTWLSGVARAVSAAAERDILRRNAEREGEHG